jgi:hypothetical protein
VSFEEQVDGQVIRMKSDLTPRLTLLDVPLRTSMSEDIFLSVSIAQLGASRRTSRCRAVVVGACALPPSTCRPSPALLSP